MENALAIFSPQDCIRDHCPDEASACSHDPACLRALQDCEHECNDNQTCWTNCVAKKGNAPASAFWKCVVDNDCLNQVSKAVAITSPRECIDKYCMNEKQACEKNQKCLHVLDVCGKICLQDVDCWGRCLKEEKSDVADIYVKCIVDHDCQDQVD